MHAWQAIQKTLDYIENHLDEEIGIETLAAQAALSPFYCQRLFSRLVKKPVREYIKLRRLARACTLLTGSDARILDIALDCGFANHETLTRAFKEAYGLTPGAYRARPIPLNQFDKPDLMLGYVLADEGVPLISEGLVLQMDRRALEAPVRFMGITGVIPIAGQLPLGEATGVDLPGGVWRRFHQIKGNLPRLAGGREIGVSYLGDAPSGSFIYFAGAEVAAGARDDRFTAWTLPARDYVVCGFEAENFEQLTTVAINKAVKYCTLWMRRHGLVMSAQEYAPEIYYDSSPDACYMELWLPFCD